MADTQRTLDDATGQLFEHMDDVKAGMLGVDGSGQHMQPMAHYIDRDTRSLWFITASDTDLVRAVGPGADAHHCVIGKNHDFYACLKGRLTVSADTEKLDEIWNAVAAAWFEDGRDDAKVTLLKMDLMEASVWSNTSSSMLFAFEIARANLSATHKPEIGEHKIIDLAA